MWFSNWAQIPLNREPVSTQSIDHSQHYSQRYTTPIPIPHPHPMPTQPAPTPRSQASQRSNNQLADTKYVARWVLTTILIFITNSEIVSFENINSSSLYLSKMWDVSYSPSHTDQWRYKLVISIQTRERTDITFECRSLLNWPLRADSSLTEVTTIQVWLHFKNT